MRYLTFEMHVDPSLYGYSFNGEPQTALVTYSVLRNGPDPSVYVQQISMWPPLMVEIKNMPELTRQANHAAKNNALSNWKETQAIAQN